LIAQALGVRDWGEMIKTYNDAHPIGDAAQRCVEFVHEVVSRSPGSGSGLLETRVDNGAEG